MKAESGISKAPSPLLCGGVGHSPCPSLACLPGGALVHFIPPLSALGSLAFLAGWGSLGGGEAGTPGFVALDKSLILGPFYLLREPGHGLPLLESASTNPSRSESLPKSSLKTPLLTAFLL